MNRTQFPRLGETCFETELDNGLTICVIPRPGYLKSYAFFATGYGGMNLRFRTEDGWQDSPPEWLIFWSTKCLTPRRATPSRYSPPTVLPPTPLPWRI